MQRQGARALFNFRHAIQNREAPLQADHPGLQVAGFVGQSLKWLIKLRNVGHHHQQGSDSQNAAAYVEHADIERGRSPTRYGQANERIVDRLRKCKPNLSGAPQCRSADEPFVLSIFLREGFDDANASHHFLNHGHSPRVQSLHGFRLSARLLASSNRQNQQDGCDPQRDQSQRSVLV